MLAQRWAYFVLLTLPRAESAFLMIQVVGSAVFAVAVVGVSYVVVAAVGASYVVAAAGAAYVSDVTGDEGNMSSFGKRKGVGPVEFPSDAMLSKSVIFLTRSRKTNSESGERVLPLRGTRGRRVRNPKILTQQRLLPLL